MGSTKHSWGRRGETGKGGQIGVTVGFRGLWHIFWYVTDIYGKGKREILIKIAWTPSFFFFITIQAEVIL